MKEKLINNFLKISNIPRESSHEEKIANFFIDIAKENNLDYYKDKYNNVLIKKKGNRKSLPIAIQAHFDMVCKKEKNSTHDFNKNGIDVIIDNNRVTAKDTTLGADQGVGLAIMLTIMEDNTLNTPDIEFLFTTEEETTFNGVVKYPYHLVNSKRLINLDNFHDNNVIVGSDGDKALECLYTGKLIKNNYPSYKITIDKFIGGNSGDNIELSKNNAINTMANTLKEKDIYLKSINGGTTENDIATSCEVIINTNENINDIFKNIDCKIDNIKNDICFSKEDTKNIINEILELKSGFISNNNSSANLGLIKTNNNEIKIYYIIRSIYEQELNNLYRNSISLNNKFIVKELYNDSIWNLSKDSNLLKVYKDIYFKEYKEYPKEDINHGGSECAAINKRISNLDMISIGANIEHFHTTKEVTYIDSWIKIYNLLIKLLETIN